jgi:hypothetical protein
MIPLKWKIFAALNLVLALPALVSGILVVITLFTAETEPTAYLVLFCQLAITGNGFLNIYFLQRYFPDKLVPGSIRKLGLLALIVNIPVCLIMLALCIYGSTLQFEKGESYDRDEDHTDLWILLILIVLWILQLVILVMQAKLRSLIHRNHRANMNQLIESIGQ